MARKGEVVRGVGREAAGRGVRKGSQGLVLPAEVGCVGDTHFTIEGISTVDGYTLYPLPCGMVVRVRSDSGTVVGRTARKGQLSCPPATLDEVRADVEALRGDCEAVEATFFEALQSLRTLSGLLVLQLQRLVQYLELPDPLDDAAESDLEASERVLRQLRGHLQMFCDIEPVGDAGEVRDEVCDQEDTSTRIFDSVGDLDGERHRPD